MNPRELDIYVERYMNGDNSAFDIIYEETKKIIYLSIYAIIRNQSAIEDLMQDTYMKIISSMDYYNLGTNFKAWVSRVARNTALNYYNKQKKVILVDSSENELIFGQTENNNYLLNDALNVLEGYEKDVFIHRIIAGFTLKEISAIMSMPLTTVHYIYKKAIKKVKKKLVGDNNEI